MNTCMAPILNLMKTAVFCCRFLYLGSVLVTTSRKYHNLSYIDPKYSSESCLCALWDSAQFAWISVTMQDNSIYNTSRDRGDRKTLRGGRGKKSYSSSVVSGRRKRKEEKGGKGKLCLGGKTNKRERREEFGIGAAGGVSSTQINAQE